MQITDAQLLKQLRKSTHQLRAESSKPEHQALLGSMDVVINELLSRSAKDFYLQFYARGRALLAEAEPRAGEIPATLDPELSSDAIGARTVAIMQDIDRLVDALGATRDPKQQGWLKRVTDWEVSLFAHRLERYPASDEQPDAIIDENRLQAYLRAKRPDWTGLEISHFHRIAGGFSKETILFDTVDQVNGKQSLCVRAEQPIHMLDFDGFNLRNEFHVVRTAWEHGIPVPEPLWVEGDTSPLGTSFIISRKAPGKNFGTAKGAEGQLKAKTVKDIARVMAEMHNIPLTRGQPWIEESHFQKWLDAGETVRDNTLFRIQEWRSQGEAARNFPSPCITRALNWLTANVPDCHEPPVFLHGDFGPHNVMLRDGLVSAVLDWEVSTPGDPACDVAWFLNSTQGSVDRQQFLDTYRSFGGKALTEYRLRYFDVFVCMAVPVTCHAALRKVQDNDAANIALAFLALQFMHEYPSRLEAAIARAEEVK